MKRDDRTESDRRHIRRCDIAKVNGRCMKPHALPIVARARRDKVRASLHPGRLHDRRLWCVLRAALLPYVPFGLARANSCARAEARVAALEGSPRALGRSQGFRLSVLAAAVIVSHIAKAPTPPWLARPRLHLARLAHMRST